MSAHHSHSPGHDHPHGAGDHRAGSRRRLAWTLALVVLYMGAEVIGGLLTGSLALLSDAGHMFSDAASLALALFALWIASRPRNPERTFGYHRTEILAALANGVTLLVVAVFIVVEAWERFAAPPEVAAGGMMAVAAGGLGVNLAGLWLLHGGRHDSLNLRGAWLHVLSDLLGSFQALAAGALIWAFGWAWADPLAAVLIALLVVASSWTLLRDSVHVLMEGTPRHLDSEEIAGAIAAVASVDGVHDLHVWTITSGFDSLSVHVRAAEREPEAVLAEVRDLVREQFRIDHATIQVEREDGCLGCD